MPNVTANGLNLYFEDVGRGPAVMLIHGLAGDISSWRTVMPELSRSHRIIACDLRGHGRSAKPISPADYSIDQMARDIVAVTRGIDVHQICLVGHSLGGRIALHLALESPELLWALVLVSTSGGLGPAARRPLERDRLSKLCIERGPMAVFEDLSAGPMASALEDHPHLREVYRRQFAAMSSQAYVGCQDALSRHPPRREDLRAISLPTLVLTGEFDQGLLQASEALHETIPGSELRIIASANHSPQLERPTAFSDAVGAFWLRLRYGEPTDNTDREAHTDTETALSSDRADAASVTRTVTRPRDPRISR